MSITKYHESHHVGVIGQPSKTLQQVAFQIQISGQDEAGGQIFVPEEHNAENSIK